MLNWLENTLFPAVLKFSLCLLCKLDQLLGSAF